MSRCRTGRQPEKRAKALGGRLLLGEWFAAAEAESLIDAVDPATGLRRAQEAFDLSQNTESMIGEALAERAIGRALAAGREGPQEALLHLTRSVEICEKSERGSNSRAACWPWAQYTWPVRIGPRPRPH